MKKKGVGFPFVCTDGSNPRLKFQIETLKIERSIAVIPLVIGPAFLRISWWVTNWAGQLISIVSLRLQDSNAPVGSNSTFK